MNCSTPGCTHVPTHEFAFPGGPLQYICEEHRAGRDGVNIVDPLTTSSMVALFKLIGGEPTLPEASRFCTARSHDPKHQEQAVLAYEFPNGANPRETESVVEGAGPNTPRNDGSAIEPGIGCPACIAELVNSAQVHSWPVKLAVL